MADREQEACGGRDAFTSKPSSFWYPARQRGDGGGGVAGCGGQEPVAAGPDPAAAAEVTQGGCAAGMRGAGSREQPFKWLRVVWVGAVPLQSLALQSDSDTLVGFCSDLGTPQAAAAENGIRN